MKQFQEMAIPSRYPNIVITISVVAYIFQLAHVGDAVGNPRTFLEKLPFILVWIATHFTIGWASATHAWNGLIATLDTAVKPLGWDADRKTEHQERLESFLGLIGGTRLTVLIVSALFFFPIALSVLNLITDGYLIEFDAESRQLATIFLVSPGLFAFASWVFLNSRLAKYYIAIRPAITQAQLDETGKTE
jgi:hypothetical protein